MRVLYLAGFIAAFAFMTSPVNAAEIINQSADWEEFYFFRYLISRPAKLEPQFDRETGECMTEDEVRACVVCYAQNETKYKSENLQNIDHELAKYTSFQLHAHKVKVVTPDQVKSWLEQNKEWQKIEEIGAAFKTTYVIYIELSEFSLMDEELTNHYRGRSESVVSVWKMDEDGLHAEKIFSAEKTARYPMHQPVSSEDKSYATFKHEFLTAYGNDIGRFFYEYDPADEIVPKEILPANLD